jgi:hypothetical protein
MYATYIYPQSGGNITLTISNLPSGDYNLYTYGHGGAANQNSTFTLSSNQVAIGQLSTSTNSNWQQSSNWISGLQFVSFTNNIHFNAGDVASVVVSPNSSAYAVINGLQISAYDQSPVVSVSADQSITFSNHATLIGTVTDDSYPPNHALSNSWSKASGYGTVTFNPQNGVGSSLQTTSSFSSFGTYTLRFTSSDSQLSDFGDVLVSVNPTNVPARDTAWVEDAAPRGSVLYPDSDIWNWISSSPAPLSGNLSHQSLNTSGEHQHYFISATQTMVLSSNDWLFCYVNVQTNTMPSEIMVQWLASDGTWWNHRAYWGADMITEWGTRTNIGTMPDSGRWVRLSVPANAVDLVGRTVNGMAFTLYDGQASWDLTGKSTGSGYDDTDGDGKTDSDEVYVYHTDPNIPD